MKKIIVSVVVSISLLFFSGQSSFASSVVAEEGSAFVAADGSLRVIDTVTLEDKACLLDPADGVSLVSIISLESPSDVVIDGTDAVVTIHPENPLNPDATVTDIAVVDASACFSSADDIDVTECISTVDLNEGLLIIPCVDVGGDVVTVHMEQRGNSSNWEVSFLGENIKFDNDDGSDDN